MVREITGYTKKTEVQFSGGVVHSRGWFTSPHLHPKAHGRALTCFGYLAGDEDEHVTGIQWGEASESAKHPTAHRMEPPTTTKNDLTQNVNSATVKKLHCQSLICVMGTPVSRMWLRLFGIFRILKEKCLQLAKGTRKFFLQARY